MTTPRARLFINSCFAVINMVINIAHLPIGGGCFEKFCIFATECIQCSTHDERYKIFYPNSLPCSLRECSIA